MRALYRLFFFLLRFSFQSCSIALILMLVYVHCVMKNSYFQIVLECAMGTNIFVVEDFLINHSLVFTS